MASASGGDKLDKELARFGFKGPGIRATDKEHFDIMAAEFPAYTAQIETINATEDEILRIGREARDSRFVGTSSGRIARAVGSLADGSGYLVDAQGKPINRTQQAPITPMKRKAADW